MTHTEYMRGWRDRNREKVREADRKYRLTHPERVQQARAKDYAKHSDRYKERAHSWRAANLEQARRNEDAWKAEHRPEMRHYARSHRARQRGASESGITYQEWLAILDRFQSCCAYCGSSERVEQDHVVPVSKGGPDTAENVVPACRSCNAHKHTSVWSPSMAFGR